MTARPEIAIPRVAAWCRKADDPIVRDFADQLVDHLADHFRLAPDHPARDLAVREAAELFYGEGSSKARRAALLAASLAQYRACCDWRERDRYAQANPYPPGARRHWLWRILRAVDTPLKAEAIRKIIR